MFSLPAHRSLVETLKLCVKALPELVLYSRMLAPSRASAPSIIPTQAAHRSAPHYAAQRLITGTYRDTSCLPSIRVIYAAIRLSYSATIERLQVFIWVS